MMSDAMSQASVLELYDRLNGMDKKEFVTYIKSEWSVLFEALPPPTSFASSSATTTWSQDSLEKYCELVVAMQIGAPQDRQDDLIGDLLSLVYDLFKLSNMSSFAAARALLESLMLILDDLPGRLAQRILTTLAELADAPEGVLRSEECGGQLQAPPKQRALLRGLLQVGLYREVTSFLRVQRQVRASPDVGHVAVPTIAFLSRKGGVGKSVLTLATALWFIRNHAEKSVCIVDLDLTGPVWQYGTCQ